MKIPFKYLPGSWGLRGKTRQIAEAEYYLSGYELDCELAKINSNNGYDLRAALIDIDLKHNKTTQYDAALAKLYNQFKYGKITAHEEELMRNTINHSYGKIDDYVFDKNQLDIDIKYNAYDDATIEKKRIDFALKHNNIDQYAADMRYAELKYNNVDDKSNLELDRLDIDFKHGKISQQDYEKKKSDLSGVAYMAMPKISWDPKDPSKTYMELDYNEHFINDLIQNGYKGTEEEIIDLWLKDVCYAVLNDMEETDVLIDRPVRSIRRDDGKTEHH